VRGGYRAEWCVARESGEYVRPESSSAPFAADDSVAALAAVMDSVAEMVESSRSRVVAVLRGPAATVPTDRKRPQSPMSPSTPRGAVDSVLARIDQACMCAASRSSEAVGC
jgi:hypothetical protein